MLTSSARSVAIAVGVAGALSLLASTASAEGPYEARWNLASSFADITGNGHTATLDPTKPGASIVPGTGTYFNDNGRLLIAPSAGMSPGASDFTFGIRVRTNDAHSNLFQAGTTKVGEHFLKIETGDHRSIWGIDGVPQCRVTGSLKSLSLWSDTSLKDGNWHWIECARWGALVELRVDGCVKNSRKVDVGQVNVANREWAIGAKPGKNVGGGDSLLGYASDAFFARSALPPVVPC